ncbi:MAG: hypothetical protein V1793_25150 [Pseudomonadota bacterium]
MHRNEKLHKSMHLAETGGWIPSVREAAIIIDRYFQWYAQQEHTDLNFIPADRFLAGRGPGIDLHQLHQDFLVPVDIHVRRGRAVLWGIDYESDGFVNLEHNLALTARVDANDMSRVWCYTKKEGIYIGEAYPVQACHPLARELGDQVSVAQVEYQIKRQRRIIKNTKKQLKELAGLSGLDENVIDINNMLPYTEKVPILPARTTGKKQKQLAAPLSDQKIKQLEQICRQAEQENDLAPVIQRPKYWNSDLEHYEWVFQLVYKHGQNPNPDDQAFYNEFESLPEFKNYRQRFEDLKLIYKP